MNVPVNRVVLEFSWPNTSTDNIVEGVHSHTSSTNLGKDLHSEHHHGGGCCCHAACLTLVICYSGGGDDFV